MTNYDICSIIHSIMNSDLNSSHYQYFFNYYVIFCALMVVYYKRFDIMCISKLGQHDCSDYSNFIQVMEVR
jgi:hypothetical protein